MKNNYAEIPREEILDGETVDPVEDYCLLTVNKSIIKSYKTKKKEEESKD